VHAIGDTTPRYDRQDTGDQPQHDGCSHYGSRRPKSLIKCPKPRQGKRLGEQPTKFASNGGAEHGTHDDHSDSQRGPP